MNSPAVKRWFDLLAAAVLLAVLAPVMAATACLILFAMGRPILFRQRRIGENGRPFDILKFRTMQTAENPTIESDALRLTPLGRLLRKYSLDELPQLVNVLRGEMSLVGPRPLLPQYWDRYTAYQKRRHEAKPGITGWAQVNGRNEISWDARFERDVWYVDHRDFWLDLAILGMTVGAAVRRSGISRPGHATMPEFLGAESERES